MGTSHSLDWPLKMFVRRSYPIRSSVRALPESGAGKAVVISLSLFANNGRLLHSLLRAISEAGVDDCKSRRTRSAPAKVEVRVAMIVLCMV